MTQPCRHFGEIVTDLVLIGAGGHGRVCADTAEATGNFVPTFLDDCWPDRSANADWPIRGKIDLWQTLDSRLPIFVSIGHNLTRLKLGRTLVDHGRSTPSLQHPSAVVSKRATIGRGTIILAGAVIQPCAVVGDFCIVNTGATIDHDCQIADGVHISPGAHLAGGVSVGEASWIGIGAVVREGCKVGRGTMVGAGATVVSHVPDQVVVTGTPARPKI